MKKGSTGVGGRRYQIAAVALTYAAVSLSAIPIGISFYMKDKKPAAHASSNPANSSTSAASTDTPNGEVVAIPGAPSSKPKPAAGTVIATLLFAGLASPFLELSSGFSGIIGLVILFVGIRIAWKITSAPPLEILGPFDPGASAAPPVPSGS
jgi:hypothetical protein